jgi:hypothetical protein
MLRGGAAICSAIWTTDVSLTDPFTSDTVRVMEYVPKRAKFTVGVAVFAPVMVLPSTRGTIVQLNTSGSARPAGMLDTALELNARAPLMAISVGTVTELIVGSPHDSIVLRLTSTVAVPNLSV